MSERAKAEAEVPEGDAPAEPTVRDLAVGDGPEAEAGMVVKVHCAGVTFSTGKEFDSSWERGEPYRFAPGGGKSSRARAGGCGG